MSWAALAKKNPGPKRRGGPAARLRQQQRTPAQKPKPNKEAKAATAPSAETKSETNISNGQVQNRQNAQRPPRKAKQNANNNSGVTKPTPAAPVKEATTRKPPCNEPRGPAPSQAPPVAATTAPSVSQVISSSAPVVAPAVPIVAAPAREAQAEVVAPVVTPPEINGTAPAPMPQPDPMAAFVPTIEENLQTMVHGPINPPPMQQQDPYSANQYMGAPAPMAMPYQPLPVSASVYQPRDYVYNDMDSYVYGNYQPETQWNAQPQHTTFYPVVYQPEPAQTRPPIPANPVVTAMPPAMPPQEPTVSLPAPPQPQAKQHMAFPAAPTQPAPQVVEQVVEEPPVTIEPTQTAPQAEVQVPAPPKPPNESKFGRRRAPPQPAPAPAAPAPVAPQPPPQPPTPQPKAPQPQPTAPKPKAAQPKAAQPKAPQPKATQNQVPPEKKKPVAAAPSKPAPVPQKNLSWAERAKLLKLKKRKKHMSMGARPTGAPSAQEKVAEESKAAAGHSQAKTMGGKKSQQTVDEIAKLMRTIGRKKANELPIYKIRGIVNNKNNCYLNSVMQALLSVPWFTNIYKNMDKEKAKEIGPCTYSMCNLMASLSIAKAGGGPNDIMNTNALDPEVVLADMLKKWETRPGGGSTGQHEDAHEFFQWLLVQLHEESKLPAPLEGTQAKDEKETKQAQQPKSVDQNKDDGDWCVVGQGGSSLVINSDMRLGDSPINLLFGGRLRNTTKTRNKNNPPSVNTEPFLSLSLDMWEGVNSIDQALTVSIGREDVSVRPNGKGKSVRATRITKIETLPRVFAMHLKRFQTVKKNEGKVPVKIRKFVEFPPELQIKKKFLHGSKKGSTKYFLRAILSHHGFMNKGHYTCIVYNDRMGGWVLVDDKTIKQTSNAKALKAQAYMLIYERA